MLVQLRQDQSLNEWSASYVTNCVDTTSPFIFGNPWGGFDAAIEICAATYGAGTTEGYPWNIQQCPTNPTDNAMIGCAIGGITQLAPLTAEVCVNGINGFGGGGEPGDCVTVPGATITGASMINLSCTDDI